MRQARVDIPAMVVGIVWDKPEAVVAAERPLLVTAEQLVEGYVERRGQITKARDYDVVARAVNAELYIVEAP